MKYIQLRHLQMLFTLIAANLLASAWGGVDASVAPAPAYSAPLVVTRGGIYSGSWESTDPTVPAVTVNTTAPVTIENCRLRGRGHLISSVVTGSNITVRNCAGQGVVATVAGIRPGRFITLYQPAKLTAEYNTLNHTGGIYVDGAGAPVSLGISVRYNKALNIEGRLSNGSGGYSTTAFERTQFVQLNSVRHTKNIEIAWNEVLNEPYNSRVEDNINLYLSSGTADSPMLIHDNYIQGAYASDPLSQSFSGGGIITDGSTSVMADSAGHINIYNNQVVGTSNYGIAIAAGHDIKIYDNRAVSTGLLPAGHRIYAANIGSYVAGQANDISSGTFANNTVTSNTIGWIHASGAINNFWFPSCIGTNKCQGNQGLSGAVTPAMEVAEYTVWMTKLTSKALRLGSALSN